MHTNQKMRIQIHTCVCVCGTGSRRCLSRQPRRLARYDGKKCCGGVQELSKPQQKLQSKQHSLSSGTCQLLWAWRGPGSLDWSISHKHGRNAGEMSGKARAWCAQTIGTCTCLFVCTYVHVRMYVRIRGRTSAELKGYTFPPGKSGETVKKCE